MVEVASAEFQKNFGRYQDEALRRPVTVTRNGRARLVVLSVEEYNRLTALDRVAVRMEDLPGEMAAALEAASMDPRHDSLDAELDE
ncbi:MAG: type II toxin-antitoxin system Phd/YefM family antitoxin [Alphaproteobacteria bacterium]